MTENGESSAHSLENQIIELAKTKPDGISNKDIQYGLSGTPAEAWTTIINKLLKSG